MIIMTQNITIITVALTIELLPEILVIRIQNINNAENMKSLSLMIIFKRNCWHEDHQVSRS